MHKRDVMKSLLIIPGHLGRDSGAIGNDQREDRINLQQAISVCTCLYAMDFGIPFFLVVPKNTVHSIAIKIIEMSVPLTITNKILLANESCSGVVEIHNNSADNKEATGFEILCFSKFN